MYTKYILLLFMPAMLFVVGFAAIIIMKIKYKNISIGNANPAVFAAVIAFLINQASKVQDKITRNYARELIWADLIVIVACICYLFVAYSRLYISGLDRSIKDSQEKRNRPPG